MASTATCPHCRRKFSYETGKAGDPPRTCGQLECRNRETWRDEDWAGAARMAIARQAAGGKLTELDREALRKVGDVGP